MIDNIEKNLIGMLFLKSEIIASVSPLVNVEDFTDRTAAKIFQIAKDKFSRNEPFDISLVAAQMPDSVMYISDSMDVIPINHKAYAAEINNSARKRRLLAGMSKIISQNSQPTTADDLLGDIGSLHLSEIKSAKKGYDIASVTERVQREIAKNHELGKLPGVPTGFSFLFQNYVQYVPGHIWVITGFTSTGKSKLLIEKVVRAGSANILIISTEMSETQILTRIYARETGINENLIMSGQYGDSERAKMNRAVKHVAGMNLKIVDDIYELTDIEAVIQQEAMGGGVDIVFLDYVQNCSVKGIPRKEQGHEMAIRLQQLAKTAKTCLVCFSQVSNSVGRGDVEQFEAKGAGEWAAVADVGVRLKRKKEDPLALLYDMQKGRHYRTLQKELRFSDNYTSINES